MATSGKDFSKPSTGQDFTTESNGFFDLSDGSDPFAGQSMCGSNTMSERPPFGAAGSHSEGAELTESIADQGGMVSHVETALGSDSGAADSSVDVKINDHGGKD